MARRWEPTRSVPRSRSTGSDRAASTGSAPGTTPVLLASLLLAAGSAAGQSVGPGFHGYEWGTPAERISEVEAEAPPEARGDGWWAYGRPVRLLGMPSHTVFYFDSTTGGLVGGKYMAEPPDLSCVGRFRTLRLMTGSGLERVGLLLERGAGGEAASLREACRRFLEASAPEPWSAVFVDSAAGDTTARVLLFRREGRPRLLSCYRLMDDCVWSEDQEVDESPVLAPAEADTVGGHLE